MCDFSFAPLCCHTLHLTTNRTYCFGITLKQNYIPLEDVLKIHIILWYINLRKDIIVLDRWFLKLLQGMSVYNFRCFYRTCLHSLSLTVFVCLYWYGILCVYWFRSPASRWLLFRLVSHLTIRPSDSRLHHLLIDYYTRNFTREIAFLGQTCLFAMIVTCHKPVFDRLPNVPICTMYFLYLL